MPSNQAAPSPWVLAGHPTSPGDPSALVTLVDGQTFCLSSRAGDFHTNPTHGVFFADMRVLSQARLSIGGSGVEALGVYQPDSTAATFIGRCHPSGHTDGWLMVVRRRTIGAIWHEVLEVRNTSAGDVSVPIELLVAADFAEVLAIKEGREATEGTHSLEVREHSLAFRWRLGEIHRQAELSVSADGAQVSNRGFHWTAEIPCGQTWKVELDLAVAIGNNWIQRRHIHPDMPDAARRNREWLAGRPRLRTADAHLFRAYERSVADIAALLLHDPSGERRTVVAAGAPWYMTLFGRDALITSYMAMPIDPDLALGVLDVLAEMQGTNVDAVTEEQPGRIVHETRSIGLEKVTLTGHSRYYGAVDATPLFVVLLGELARWGIADDDLARLLPHADRALRWMEDYGDRDGDGFIEYERSSERGLVNQGWKDSVDAIRYADGRNAVAPLALCEVQGYAYAAYRARAAIAARLGDGDAEQRCRQHADTLKERFNRQFWLDDRGWFAVALDPDKQPVDSLTSNIGHCLWSGIVDESRAAMVAKHLMSPAMWTGWGVRTLAADERAYDPMSYHCGTVWPHDAALCAAGLAAYGFIAEAMTIAEGLLAASDGWAGRLPEFFCGLDRQDVAIPVPFPTSCSPQAWAAATPFLLLRLMLGLQPDDDNGLSCAPIPGALPTGTTFTGVRSRGAVFDIRVDEDIASAVAR